MNINNAIVRDVHIEPVYGVGENSGIKIYKVIFTIGWLLIKSFLRRMKQKYIIRDFHPLIFFYFLGIIFMIIHKYKIAGMLISYGKKSYKYTESRLSLINDFFGSIIDIKITNKEKNTANLTELKSVEDNEIKKVIKLQEELGFKVVTDGEFRRSFWHYDFLAFWYFPN